MIAAALVVAQLVCTSAGKPVQTRAPVTDELACAIEVRDTGGASIDAGSLDLRTILDAGAPYRDHAALAHQGTRWAPDQPIRANAVGRSAVTTIHAELREGDHLAWSQDLVLRPICPAVRFATPPQLSCVTPVTRIDTTFDPAEDARHPRWHQATACEVTIDRAPSNDSYGVYFTRAPAGPDDDPLDDSDPLEPAGDGLSGGHDFPAEGPPCGRVRVDAFVSRAGEVVWSGHTSYAAKCPRAKP